MLMPESFKSERLSYRVPTNGDRETILRWRTTPEIAITFRLSAPSDFADFVMEHWTKYGFGFYVIERTSDGRALGLCGVKNVHAHSGTELPEDVTDVEIGYLLEPMFWHKGYARESARSVLLKAFEVLNVPKILLICNRENDRSIAVAQSIGMLDDETNPLNAGSNRVFVRRRDP